MSREKRREIVKQVLRNRPDVRDFDNALILNVWRHELGGRDFTVDNILRNCSSASGILRDRRRSDVIVEFPRSERKFKAFESYLDEYGNPIMFER